MTIKITPNDKGNPPGKLAEAELHFTDGPLEGLKLIGFSIWERRVDVTSQNKLRELILEAYQDHEERAAIAS